MCNKLFFEQVTCTVNGKQMSVKDDGAGNIQIEGEIQSDIASEQIVDTMPTQYNNDIIDNLISLLTSELDESIKASRAAKTYSKYNSDDISKVMFNQGFAEGKKKIIKLVLKHLTNAEMENNNE